MLKIRKEQNDELAKVALKRFEDSMVEHIKKFFPRYYEVYGESLIRGVIKYAIDRAKTHGFRSERDVCLYINLALLLGSNFDEDSQLPWTAAILKDETIKDPVIRIDNLYDKAMKYLDQVLGAEDEHLERVLLRFREISIEDFAQTPTPNAGDVAATQLQRIWPRKCQHMGDTTFRRLIRDGVESTKVYNIATERGVVVYTAMMFLLGGEFDKDPQFPWAAKVLNDQSEPEQNIKVNQLYKQATTFLEKWST